jgi:hypothetical protein
MTAREQGLNRPVAGLGQLCVVNSHGAAPWLDAGVALQT